ncbi:radical SAM/SPASM domain-containing protein [Paenibacillus ihumii]|uniref:radical SAM/SPASM domain-containing protein n=1 Tax=Paenibacillus ihumii TaxID=687436 RepID=UPI0006D77925|nr:radical SAM protein [Paenibacillus ihumii]
MPFMPFQTRPNLFYVYDMNRNSVYRTSQQQYESLCRVNSGSNEPEDIAILKKYQEQGMLLDSQIVKVQHPATEFLEYQLKRCVNSITFQMSQNCNLRCSYCPYSNNGIYENRTHLAKNIKWETIKKGIDFLITHSKDVDHLHVAFYGGEPLIAKDLVISTMEYTLNRVNGKDISFGMTTNATLLDDEFAKAACNYNLTIMVSLDGPKEIHDKNRSYASGRGSYDVLYQNIKRIKEKYPQLYERLKFNAVISPGSNYRQIFDFFRSNQDIVDPSKVSFNTLSLNYTDSSFGYEEDYFAERNYETLKAYLILLGKLKIEPISYHKTDIETIFSFKEFFTPIKDTSSVAHPSGTCIPGLKKLFVDVNGDFFPCERINENSTFMRMGNVEQGFEIDKVREILNVGSVTEEHCKDCWAFHCCSLCPASTDNGKNERYSQSYKLSKCNRVRATALENLKNYTMLREFKYQFNKEELIP